MTTPLVRPGAVTPAEDRALGAGLLAHRREAVARFVLRGPGRVACIQGIVTCDVQNADPARGLFGGLLTAKGMIVAPLWLALLPEEVRLEAPAEAAAPLEDLFRRTLPPRQCRWENVTAATASVGLYGPAATPFPRAVAAAARGLVGFEAQLPLDEAGALVDDAVGRGAVAASPALLERCRIEAGIPRLGAEIDERTLPQEVRFEELGAVSYTKGCYIGQETVARLHFRGHANRRLVSVDLPGDPGALPAELRQEGKPVGRLTSAAWSDTAHGWIGLAVVRREVADGSVLDGDGFAAMVRAERWLRTP